MFYKKGSINPVDGLLWCPDYLKEVIEADSIPITCLLLLLRARIASKPNRQAEDKEPGIKLATSNINEDYRVRLESITDKFASKIKNMLPD